MSEDVERVAAIKAELARHGGVAFSEGSTHCLCGAPLDTAEVKMPLREHLARAIAAMTPTPDVDVLAEVRAGLAGVDSVDFIGRRSDEWRQGFDRAIREVHRMLSHKATLNTKPTQ